MSDQSLPVNFNKVVEFNIPSFKSIQEQFLDMEKTREAESRILETKIINGGTYNELSFVMNEAYRETKTNLTLVRYNELLSEKELSKIKSEALIDKYADWLKEKKLKDSAAMRDAFLHSIEEYSQAVDRLNMLKAVASFYEGKIKVFENVCRYMRKEIDIRIRAGMVDSNQYGS